MENTNNIEVDNLTLSEMEKLYKDDPVVTHLCEGLRHRLCKIHSHEKTIDRKELIQAVFVECSGHEQPTSDAEKLLYLIIDQSFEARNAISSGIMKEKTGFDFKRIEELLPEVGRLVQATKHYSMQRSGRGTVHSYYIRRRKSTAKK